MCPISGPCNSRAQCHEYGAAGDELPAAAHSLSPRPRRCLHGGMCVLRGVVGGTPATRRWADPLAAKSKAVWSPQAAAQPATSGSPCRGRRTAHPRPRTCMSCPRHRSSSTASGREWQALDLNWPLHRIVAPPGGVRNCKGHLRRVKMALADVGRGMRKQARCLRDELAARSKMISSRSFASAHE